MYQLFRDEPRVAMYMIYTAEAHPCGSETETVSDLPTGIDNIREHKTITDRILAAAVGADQLLLTLPILVDSMDSAAQNTYHVPYCATAIIDFDGTLVYFAEGLSAGIQPQPTIDTINQVLAERPPRK